jgi:hypothetical protein
MKGQIEFGDPRLPGRFWSKAAPQGGGCWIWRAAMSGGYGVYVVDSRMFRAHRVAYEALIGPIPDGLQLDHLCRNRGCVNPLHTEPVTQIENIRRGEAGVPSGAQQRAKTHCPQGHQYNPENTYVRKNGHRLCRPCNAEAQRRYRSRNIGSGPAGVAV